jgi:hypothetical protein
VNGSGTCQAQQGRALGSGTNCDPAAPLCGPQLICNSNSVCANLCHYGASASVVNADCAGSIGGQCLRWAGADTIGYCN